LTYPTCIHLSLLKTACGIFAFSLILHECFFPQPAFAQFGGLKDIINKSKNAAKKEIEKMGGTNPNNTGTGNAPVPGASSPTADN
jgi:hypothetical protein